MQTGLLRTERGLEPLERRGGGGGLVACLLLEDREHCSRAGAGGGCLAGNWDGGDGEVGAYVFALS